MAIPDAGSSSASELPARDVLTDREVEILAFERQWWKFPGAKDTAIRELFGMSPTSYYQLLNELIDDQAALAADPMLVKRLRRARAVRHRDRTDDTYGAHRR